MTEIALLNPFDEQQRAVAVSPATAQTDQHRAIAEVQAAMVVARANPRNQRVAMDRILNACQRQGLAEAAVYSYSRGGTDISGPSIRLAEAMAQNWGNIQFGIRELDQTNGASTVQAFAWDIETNTRREVTFQVRHERHTKQGAKRLTDPRDIYETVANNGARRLRACILAVIPGDVTEAAVRQCEETMKAKADTSPGGIKKLEEALAQFDVTRAQIEARIQRRIDAITPAQVVALRKVWASLRDGMSSVEDWFDGSADAQPKPKGQNGHSGQTGQSPHGAISFAISTDSPPMAEGAFWIDSMNGEVRVCVDEQWDKPTEAHLEALRASIMRELGADAPPNAATMTCAELASDVVHKRKHAKAKAGAK